MAAAIAAWQPAAVVAAVSSDSHLGRYLIRFFGPPAARRGAMLGWRVPAGLLRSLPQAHIQAEDGRRPGNPRG